MAVIICDLLLSLQILLSGLNQLWVKFLIGLLLFSEQWAHLLSNPETVAEGCTGVFSSDVACVCREHDGTATTILVFLRSYVTSLLLLGFSCAAPGFPVLAFYLLVLHPTVCCAVFAS